MAPIAGKVGSTTETLRRWYRKGRVMSHENLCRLYCEERLLVWRRGRKRARGSRTPMPVPLRPNDRWSA